MISKILRHLHRFKMKTELSSLTLLNSSSSVISWNPTSLTFKVTQLETENFTVQLQIESLHARKQKHQFQGIV